MPGDTPGPDHTRSAPTLSRAEGHGRGRRPAGAPGRRVTPTEGRRAPLFALAAGADLIVATIGGASVGEHDLVASVAQSLGLEMAFHRRIAMRPGKPLMSGRLGATPMLGLPGPGFGAGLRHPVPAPALKAMQGLPGPEPKPLTARLGAGVEANGPRAHYMRARSTATPSPPSTGRTARCLRSWRRPTRF